MSKAATTRLTILQTAFGLVYRQGYQATSVDTIISQTRVTKGAFYHHFKTKDEMGLAMINEILSPGMFAGMLQPLLSVTDPKKGLYDMMNYLLMEAPFFEVRYGCPAVNLVEEMSPLSPVFNEALSGLLLQWQVAMETAVEAGKNAGKVRSDVNSLQVARFVMAGYSGARNLGKVFGKDSYKVYLKELKNYLESLD